MDSNLCTYLSANSVSSTTLTWDHRVYWKRPFCSWRQGAGGNHIVSLLKMRAICVSDMLHNPAHQCLSSLLREHLGWQLNNCILLLQLPDSVILLLLALPCHFPLAWSPLRYWRLHTDWGIWKRVTAACSFIGAVILHWNETPVGRVRSRTKRGRR